MKLLIQETPETNDRLWTLQLTEDETAELVENLIEGCHSPIPACMALAVMLAVSEEGLERLRPILDKRPVLDILIQERRKLNPVHV